jgi:hypothetical protein
MDLITHLYEITLTNLFFARLRLQKKIQQIYISWIPKSGMDNRRIE